MYTAKEIIEFVRGNDVKFIRLSFCDLLGQHKNIAIQPDEIERIMNEGASFDGSSVIGLGDAEQSDLLLFPDPSTMRLLPWRSQRGRVIRLYCAIKKPDGTPYEGDTRRLLILAADRARDLGYACRAGAECEFYLFKTDDSGQPTADTYDEGGYFDIAPLDKGENIRREICLTLEEMGIKPEASHHERGPGQNEIDFKYDAILSTADNLMTLKAVVKAISAKNGLFASFMPKPLLEQSGNGLHLNLSLFRAGENIFREPPEQSPEASGFIAGILDKIGEITAFLNPLTNSYARLGTPGAPGYISWSHVHRAQLIRVPAISAEEARMELRSPDPAINPYLALALVLHAGLDGIEQARKLAPPRDVNLSGADAKALKGLQILPSSLTAALKQAGQSAFVRNIVGPELLERYIALRRAAAADYDQAADQAEFDRVRYFKTV
jgi:glutamine synthetase